MPVKRANKKRGRPLGTVKLEGDWESAVARALGKRRPAEGWPEKPARAAKPKARKKKRAKK